MKLSDREMGYEYERLKRLEEQNKNKIKLYKTCSVCGQKIPLETLLKDKKAYLRENVVYCKKCMGSAPEKKFRPPWEKK